MADYIRDAEIGSGSNAGFDTAFSDTMFYGASEAPRVHGLTGKIWDAIPRFKNQYFVAFQYSDLYQSADPKSMIDVTHRVKTIDAPRFDIESETLNQYNKPRTIMTKINYQPITITFWDDRSNLTTNFWKVAYQFYFRNGQRYNDAQYPILDSDIINIGQQTANTLAYENYGYYIGNKQTKKNLFQHMSLYMVANRVCYRMDLINPYMQSMQHDQFSQDSPGELAQNTVTWGYENVVYYNRTTFNQELPLMGIVADAGPSASTVFKWDSNHAGELGAGLATNQVGGSYAPTASYSGTEPIGKNPPNVTSTGPGANGPPGRNYGAIPNRDGFDYNNAVNIRDGGDSATKPWRVLLGDLPKSEIDPKISHIYWALATGREDLILNPIEAAAEAARWAAEAKASSDDTSQAVDDFSGMTKAQMKTSTRNAQEQAKQAEAEAKAKADAGLATEFEANPHIPTSTSGSGGLDQAKADRLVAQMKGENNIRTGRVVDKSGVAIVAKTPIGNVVFRIENNKSGTWADLAKQAVSEYNAMTPAQRQAADMKRRNDQERAEADRGG